MTEDLLNALVKHSENKIRRVQSYFVIVDLDSHNILDTECMDKLEGAHETLLQEFLVDLDLDL